MTQEIGDAFGVRLKIDLFIANGFAYRDDEMAEKFRGLQNISARLS